MIRSNVLFKLNASSSFYVKYNIQYIPDKSTDLIIALNFGLELFGGILDVISIVIFAPMQQIRFLNMGPFEVLGIIPAPVPITWMFDFGIFFYLMPRRMTFLIPYVLAFTGFSYVIGIIMEYYGLFQYLGSMRYWAVLVFLVWYSFSAWVFLRDVSVRTVQAVALKPIPDEKEKQD